MRAWRQLLAAALALAALVAAAAPAAAQQETADDLAFVHELAAVFRKGGTFAAQRDLDEYLVDYPACASARQLAAGVAFGRGRLAEALEHLDAGGDPDRRLRARVLLRLGRADEALQLARDGGLPELAAAWVEVSALGLRRRRAERQARPELPPRRAGGPAPVR
jgi:hypothetical protein